MTWKDVKEFIQFIMVFAFGMALICLPIFLTAYYNDSTCRPIATCGLTRVWFVEECTENNLFSEEKRYYQIKGPSKAKAIYTDDSKIADDCLSGIFKHQDFGDLEAL